MLKALLKKQFLELNQFYFKDPKTGKNRSAAGTTGFVFLFVLIFAAVAFAFVGFGDMGFSILHPLGLDWMYFGLGGALSLLVAAIVSLFFCYSSLFRAKDNALLLSLPIPPRVILSVRLSGVATMCLFFGMLTWFPLSIFYFWSMAGSGMPVAGGQIALCLLVVLAIALLAIVLVCIIGWVVAAIGGHVRNKSLVTTVVTVVLILAYFYVYFQIATMMESAVTAIAESAAAFQAYALPLYQLGLAATGDVVSFAILLLVAVVLFALVFAVMSKTFVKVATTQASVRSAQKFEASQVKTSSLKQALLSREIKRLLSIPSYMVNCGLGLVFLVIITVLAFLKAEDFKLLLVMMGAQIPNLSDMVPVVAAVIICALVSTCSFTAPSISLEGKELWIIRSLPVSASEVLAAKASMQKRIVTVPVLACSLLICYALGLGYQCMVLVAVLAWVYSLVNAYAGLALNLKYPNFIWSNPVVPVKQSMPVFVLLFGGWVLCIVLLVLYCMVFAELLGALTFIELLIVLAVVAAILLRRWVFTRGVKLFNEM